MESNDKRKTKNTASMGKQKRFSIVPRETMIDKNGGFRLYII
jgi:hypothetical protein